MLIKDFSETVASDWEYHCTFGTHQYFYYDSRSAIAVVDTNSDNVENPCTSNPEQVYLVDKNRHIILRPDKMLLPVYPLFCKNDYYLETSSIAEVFWLSGISNPVQIDYPEELRANFKIACTYKFTQD